MAPRVFMNTVFMYDCQYVVMILKSGKSRVWNDPKEAFVRRLRAGGRCDWSPPELQWRASCKPSVLDRRESDPNTEAYRLSVDENSSALFLGLGLVGLTLLECFHSPNKRSSARRPVTIRQTSCDELMTHVSYGVIVRSICLQYTISFGRATSC